MTKWFHFDDGSNPYGVWDNRPDEFFRMVLAWQPEMINHTTFQCHSPTPAYYGPTDYKFKKEALRTFAIEWQNAFGDISSSYEDLAWWSDFFTTYGRRYGLLREFHREGIC